MSGAATDAPLQPGAHATEAARVRLGSSASTPAHVLAGLACDPAVTVRAAVAMNPACPPAIDGAISQDADERVRTLLARKLASGGRRRGARRSPLSPWTPPCACGRRSPMASRTRRTRRAN